MTPTSDPAATAALRETCARASATLQRARRPLGLLLAMRVIELTAPGVETENAQGQLVFDEGKLWAFLDGLDAAAVGTLLGRIRTAYRGLDLPAETAEIALRLARREEALATDALRVELAACTDTVSIEGRARALEEARDALIAAAGPGWPECACTMARYDGLTARLALCDARAAELARWAGPRR